MRYAIPILILLSLLLAGCSGSGVIRGTGPSERVILDIPVCYNQCEDIFSRADQDGVRHICRIACHQDVAKQSSDYVDCDPIVELDPVDTGQSIHYIVCIQLLAEQNRDTEACDRIEGFIMQANCIEEIARTYNDPSACDAIHTGEPRFVAGFIESCKKKASS